MRRRERGDRTANETGERIVSTVKTLLHSRLQLLSEKTARSHCLAGVCCKCRAIYYIGLWSQAHPPAALSISWVDRVISGGARARRATRTNAPRTAMGSEPVKRAIGSGVANDVGRVAISLSVAGWPRSPSGALAGLWVWRRVVARARAVGPPADECSTSRSSAWWSCQRRWTMIDRVLHSIDELYAVKETPLYSLLFSLLSRSRRRTAWNGGVPVSQGQACTPRRSLPPAHGWTCSFRHGFPL